MSDNITLPRDVAEKIFDAFGSEVYPSASSVDWHDIMDAFRTALAAQTYELDPSIRLNGLEIALANCEKSHELTAKKYMDTFDENERLKEQMKKWMKAGGGNDTTR